MRNNSYISLVNFKAGGLIFFPKKMFEPPTSCPFIKKKLSDDKVLL